MKGQSAHGNGYVQEHKPLRRETTALVERTELQPHEALHISRTMRYEAGLWVADSEQGHGQPAMRDLSRRMHPPPPPLFPSRTLQLLETVTHQPSA